MKDHLSPVGNPAPPHDVGDDGDGLHVVDRRRAAIEAHIGRKWRLQPRHALLAFEAFQQRRLLAADVSAGPMRDDQVEIPAVDVVLADEARFVGFFHRRFERLALADILPAHIDEAGIRPHGEGGDEAALDQQVRVMPHDIPVLAGAGL